MFRFSDNFLALEIILCKTTCILIHAWASCDTWVYFHHFFPSFFTRDSVAFQFNFIMCFPFQYNNVIFIRGSLVCGTICSLYLWQILFLLDQVIYFYIRSWRLSSSSCTESSPTVFVHRYSSRYCGCRRILWFMHGIMEQNSSSYLDHFILVIDKI